MPQRSSVHLFRDFVISTRCDEGGWWAAAGPARESLGCDQVVLGGPWKNEADAVRAAEAFCRSGRAR